MFCVPEKGHLPRVHSILFYLILFTHGSLSSIEPVLPRVRVKIQNIQSKNNLFTIMDKCKN